jgi:Tautomerase enzyme
MVITEHDEPDFRYGANYLGIARSDDLVNIQLTVSNTRGVAQKKGALPPHRRAPSGQSGSAAGGRHDQPGRSAAGKLSQAPGRPILHLFSPLADLGGNSKHR